MTSSAFGTAVAIGYGLATAGYVIFALRIALGLRRSPRAGLLLGVTVATALWAASTVALGLWPSRVALVAATTADSLRYAIWYAFLAHLLRGDLGQRSAALSIEGHLTHIFPTSVVVLVYAALVGTVALAGGLPLPAVLGGTGLQFSLALHLALSVMGLVLVELMMRRAPSQARWALKPLAIAVAGVFGIDIFVYADAMLFKSIDGDFWIARGIANLLVIPLLAIATARNGGWTVEMHMSRGVIYQSMALLVSGAFLLAFAAAAYLVRYFGGDWGRALQIEVFFAAILVTALVATSGRFRARVRVFVSKHFFSYRYDYRQEWLRFTRTLSTESPLHRLQERMIMGLADLVESSSGALWQREEGRGFVLVSRWNVPTPDAVEPLDSNFARYLERTGWIVSLPEYERTPEPYSGLELPAWLSAVPGAWLIIPLLSGTELVGFVVLTTSLAPLDVNWEVRDLLKTASRQAASFLAQLQASESLLEARKFDAFNRMSAFVVHDLKNLVAQLSLMLKNAKRHSMNPDFQVDMLRTVEHVVMRMNALMLQLRTGTQPVDSPRPVNLDSLVRRVCAAKADPRVPISLELEADVTALGHDDRLEHVLGHLVQNAIDASLPEGRVRVLVERARDFASVIVADEGVGMTAEFVRDRLFKPFQTTKPAGMGIGVYESSQYVASLGGELLIDSLPGSGTSVRVRLPRADLPSAGYPHMQEQTV